SSRARSAAPGSCSSAGSSRAGRGRKGARHLGRFARRRLERATKRLPVAGMREVLAVLDSYRMALRSVIVDDNSYFLDAARELLEREGLEVVGVASTSADALRLVAELEPDVTLVDVDLGDEDGFELARRLVAAQASNVILVSTHPEAELAELVSVSPALGFIHKTRLSAQAIRDLVERAA